MPMRVQASVISGAVLALEGQTQPHEEYFDEMKTLASLFWDGVMGLFGGAGPAATAGAGAAAIGGCGAGAAAPCGMGGAQPYGCP